jgi:hypothetical protein
MIAHPDIAATAALGAYQERVEQARINHIIDRAVRTRTAAAVDATANHDLTTRTARLTQSIKRLLGNERQVFVSDSHLGTFEPQPMTTTPS